MYTAYASNLYNKILISFLKLVYQNKNEFAGTSVAFTMIASRFEKSHCLLKSSVPLPWQPNLIDTLPTVAISKLMIQTREAIPKYTLLDPVSLLWTWYFKHGIHATNFPTPDYFVMVFTSCRKWLGCQTTENFLYINKINSCVSC